MRFDKLCPSTMLAVSDRDNPKMLRRLVAGHGVYFPESGGEPLLSVFIHCSDGRQLGELEPCFGEMMLGGIRSGRIPLSKVEALADMDVVTSITLSSRRRFHRRRSR